MTAAVQLCEAARLSVALEMEALQLAASTGHDSAFLIAVANIETIMLKLCGDVAALGGGDEPGP